VNRDKSLHYFQDCAVHPAYYHIVCCYIFSHCCLLMLFVSIRKRFIECRGKQGYDYTVCKDESILVLDRVLRKNNPEFKKIEKRNNKEQNRVQYLDKEYV
jgi:hypothetical protein